MTDDLAKRLREHIAVVIDNRGRVFEDEVLCDDAADCIEELEAKLAVAVEFISNLKQYAVAIDDRHLHGKARTTLAELTGDKDE